MRYKAFLVLVTLLTSGTFLTEARADFTALAIGDTGKGNKEQTEVGEALANDCAKENCKFALLLGDNIYDVGITSPTDPQMIDKFEKPYAKMTVPFYVALGNHDYGKLANDWARGDNQIEYSRRNPSYILPSHYYSFVHDDALFLVLDTSRLFHDKDTAEQVKFIRDTLAANRSSANPKKWIIAVSHHPFISNGPHGNAGRYDGVPLPPISGSVIKDVIEKEICPHAQLVISGHDHSLQTLPAKGPCEKTLFVVSGGGASTTKLKGSNPAHFQKSMLGFTRLHFNQDRVRVSHVGKDGKVEHQYDHPIR